MCTKAKFVVAAADATTVEEYEAILADLDHLRDDLTQLANEMARATTTGEALTGVALTEADLPPEGQVTSPAGTTDFGIAAGLATPQSAEAETYVNQMFSLMVAFAMGYCTGRTTTDPRADLTKQGKF